MSEHPKWKEMTERTTILRCLVGSQAYGLSLEGGSDRDERAICVEDFEAAHNLTSPFDEYEFRTAVQRTGNKDAQSEAGDLDLKVFSLRKFLKLALQGNPNMIELLFIKGDATIAWERVGTELQDLYPYIISRNVGGRYLGYIKGQKARYLGVREGGREDLVAKWGYDTKCASHVLRLGFQAIEVLTTGKISLPMVGESQNICLDVKKGKYTLAQVNEASTALEERIKDLILTSEVRDVPDVELVERWMQGVYWSAWMAKRLLFSPREESTYAH